MAPDTFGSAEAQRSDLPTYSGGKAEQEAVYTAARRAPGPLLTVVGKLVVTTI
jgi:hypothetical protein